MYRLIYRVIVALAATLLLSNCTPYKDIVYFQDIDKVDLKQLTSEYEAVIKKDDRLIIVVSGPDKSVVAPYNLTLWDYGVGASYSEPEKATLSYLVDVEGNIEFPIFGKIHVEGMTRSQLSNYLTKRIGEDVQDPIVYVSFKGYKITVLGEVRSPGTFTFDYEKVNILQALGRAGDLNLTAERDNILILREVDGVQTHAKVDLRDSHLLDSPYFYLQQNDVIVVPPSPTRVSSATMATSIINPILSSVTTVLSIITVVLTLARQKA